uniref:Calponin-homology (CH) domain-containing protein n=1 Tax=Laticauda laticaudata TaxID=8630 RepID=A0A8C5SE87_LATLA
MFSLAFCPFRSWQREEEQRQQKSLDALSRKLETIQDVEELTSLLRGTSEYEERKLIRAAIRQLRAEEIEAAKLAEKAFNHRRVTDTARASNEQEENSAGDRNAQVQNRVGEELVRSQIQEPLDPKVADDPAESSSATILLLETVPSHQPSESSPFPGEEASGEDLGPNSCDQDSGLEPQSLPSEEEEEAGGLAPLKVQEGLNSSGGEAASKAREEEPLEMGSVGRDVPPKEQSLLSQKREVVPQAPEERGEGASGQEGDREATGTSQTVETDGYEAPTKPPSAEPCREQPFQRASSIRERARQFSSDPANPTAAPQKAGKGLPVLLPQHLPPSRHAANSPLTDRGGTAIRTLRPSSEAQDAARTVPSHAKAGPGRPPSQALSVPKEAGGPQGRFQGSQWQERKLAPARSGVENSKGAPTDSEVVRGQQSGCAHGPADSLAAHPDDEMKTLLTIEIKDSRHQPRRGHLGGPPGNQRAELTLGLRNSPLRITTSSHGGSSGSFEKRDAELPMQPKVAPLTRTEKVQEERKPNRLSTEELSKIEEEDVLDKMLDQTRDFEERRLIRAAMRDLRQRKRDQREKERKERLQEAKAKGGSHTTETTSQQSRTSADGSAVSTVTKTQRLLQSNDGNKASRTITMEASYTKRSEKDGNTFAQTKSYSSSSSKKVGSIFEREDPSPRPGSSLADLERRQAERKKEIMKAQAMPKMSTSQARKAMIEKLEKEGGSPASPAMARVAIQRSSSFGVPNANTIKQMLLDWCRAKTRGYEHVDIQNFSSSWSDGMAFCALVHNFFPEAFDYTQLSPQDRRHNFEMAFSAAETQSECPQLLDVEDMVRMREPDWKCVYTYIQEFYRCLVEKGLVKTKKS